MVLHTKVKGLLILIFVVVSLCFSVFVILMSLYRSSTMINKYFPGFFVYHTKVINIYDIPEWWEGRVSNLPSKAILLKLNDVEIKEPKDFWEVVLKNVDREMEFKVEYEVGQERFIKFVKSQRFEVKDFVVFSLFWQVSGILLLLLGVIIYLGNRSKKGEMWLIANILTGVNFLTTPASSLLADIFVVTFVERVTFSLFPLSMVWLFLNFPLLKFRKQVRVIIISVMGGIGLSALAISMVGYTEVREVAILQEAYYVYPGLGGLFATFSSIYDFVRAKRHRLYQLARVLSLLSVGALMFILLPSFLAIFTTLIGIPSYYIPFLIVGYPILVISTLMTNSLQFVRRISVDLSVILAISLAFAGLYAVLFEVAKGIPKVTLFLILSATFILVSIPLFLFAKARLKIRTVYFNRELISNIFEKFKRVDSISKFLLFVNRELGRMLGFSFSRFISYKLLPPDVRKTLFLSREYIIPSEEVEEYYKEGKNRSSQSVIGGSRYVMVVKSGSKFFGIVILGKMVMGDVLTASEVRTINLVAQLLGSYLNSLTGVSLWKRSGEILKQKSRGISNILVRSVLTPVSVNKELFSIRTIISDSLDRPTVCKVKDMGQCVFFCIVWIVPESVHTLVLASIIKGVVEEYFHRGRINIHRLPREIRNIVSVVSPIEVDTNILCGVVRNDRMSMDVVNDGKTSIILVTKKNAMIPMPLHKRYFNFSKIKEEDRFFFISGDEISSQIQEIKELDIAKLNPDKFLYDLPDKVILEVSFHNKGSQ
ncbi:MAG: hypothetical protein ABDH28_05445 [Brevinematia bacterium]